MRIGEVLHALEKCAPLPLQDSFDNAGLQVGQADTEVSGVLVCLDITEAVVDEAISSGCNLVVSHHPLIFKGCKSITGKDHAERCILKAIKNDIAIYSAHTNLDNAPQGVNFKIAEKIGLKNVRILEPKEGMLTKFVTYVPAEKADTVRQALFDTGCGSIGMLHTEKEVRIETIMPSYLREKALKALYATHPYEEPAFDIYPLGNRWQQAGSGVIGELEEAEPEPDFLMHLKKTFGTGCVKHSRLTGRKIRTVALCGGAGGFLMPRAINKHADAFVTGEIKYHNYFDAGDNILLAEIGHYESEQYTQDILQEIIRKAFPDLLEVKQTKVNTNPINYM